MKNQTLSLMISSLFTCVTLFLVSCSSEEPKAAAVAPTSSDSTTCGDKGMILNSAGKCEACPAGQVVRQQQCAAPLTDSQKTLQSQCVARSADFNDMTMVCTDNTDSCLRMEPVGRKVFSETSRTCIDKLKSVQVCAPQGYDDRTDKCIQTEESCRALGQGIANGVCTGTPNLTVQQQQMKTDCTSRGLEYNALNNTCRATAAICQQNNQQFDANTGTCTNPSFWQQILPGIIGGLGQILK